eukprot:CAMPEP_0119130040 /NCGR_PEP_ID=MMETSP1310-20130426/7536_1 /TAXON_ID=464262 /ORGANISM="Genus nov. species nov., Strain RCC2339" /LENGTH=180 /DNA_ID=CAMNT_0007120507 /DNA_START=186 /DNA_END=728 /DNA_ORIENTATION=+
MANRGQHTTKSSQDLKRKYPGSSGTYTAAYANMTPEQREAAKAKMIRAQQAQSQTQQYRPVAVPEGSNQIITGRRLQHLLSEISPTETLDPQAEELLIDFAEDFVENVVQFACEVARSRSSDTLEVKDLHMHLDRNWNIRLPGYGNLEDVGSASSAATRTSTNENHLHRREAVKKRKLGK